jgi:hypothetical protein
MAWAYVALSSLTCVLWLLLSFDYQHGDSRDCVLLVSCDVHMMVILPTSGSLVLLTMRSLGDPSRHKYYVLTLEKYELNKPLYFEKYSVSRILL